MNPSIAIVGLACVYPDARTPGELWENVLAQRRAFRRLPPERLRAEDYFSSDGNAPDRATSVQGAVIEGYEFDRIAFRVAGSTFRSADLAHWLALDVAAKALADAGFPDGRGLPGQTTGVLLGNTLTGEFSRANAMRLRWPFVRRVVESALAKENWPLENRRDFLERLEADYKSPFPPVGEETLAGSLSNTIAGRICNQFNLHGGGYTVDGACASSLLAVANACSALTANDLDVALAGGVDLSLDPFELVGFAKTGALASDEMRVFDQRSAGFWPGEGCGFAVLMRHEDALAQGHRVYAVIRGWGISSDGTGGITRPESDGQLEALRRTYRRAGFGIGSVAYCEGHGTGTAVGDATELETLSRARREEKSEAPPAAIGSIKANIGHTKAAAGIAGLIKATMAVHTQVLPPTSGCEQPHSHLSGPSPALRVLREAELWPADRPLRASVSAMGFGGINAHVVLESNVAERRAALGPRERSLARSSQDAELFLLSAATPDELAQQVDKLLEIAAGISQSELADLAAQLQRTLETKQLRAAIVADKPGQLGERLQTLRSRLLAGPLSIGPGEGVRKTGEGNVFSDGVFLGTGQTPPRIAFLFPGQGSPTHLDGGIWRRRFDSVRELYTQAALPADGDLISTRVAQPAVVTASLAGLRVLEHFGVTANVAIGHSLGEITALHWAGAMDDQTLRRIARLRGETMAELGSPTGAMLAIAAPAEKVRALLKNDPLTIVGFNSPRQTVVAGDATAIGRLMRRAEIAGWDTVQLPVSHAFHTPLVSAAVPVLADHLAGEDFSPLNRSVISTVTGALLDSDDDLRGLLCRQVTSPVRFADALLALLGTYATQTDRSRRREEADLTAPQTGPPPYVGGYDLLIEVGPGNVLSGLVRDTTGAPVVAMDVGGTSLKGLLGTLGAAFALGAPVRHAALFEDRFVRPFTLERKPKYFVNPCELAPLPEEATTISFVSQLPFLSSSNGEAEISRTRTKDEDEKSEKREPMGQTTMLFAQQPSPLDFIRQLVAERAELPVAAVQDSHRMLSDLHLNSITVGQLVSEAARRLGLPRLVELTDFANATVAQMARALEELKRVGTAAQPDDKKRPPAGVDVWVETFKVELVETKLLSHRHAVENGTAAGHWKIFAPANHPLAAALREKLTVASGSGALVCLPENPSEDDISLMLDAAKAMNGEKRFVVVQHGWGGAGFARTLHLETPGLTTCVVNVPPAQPRAIEWILAELNSGAGYTEAHYDAGGRRWEPRLKWSPVEFTDASVDTRSLSSSSSFSSSSSNGEAKTSRTRTRTKDEDEERGGFPIGSGDVLLVTGGGKGIAAECALALGRETGAALALMGRSDPATDSQLAENLARIAASGLRCCYVRADVTDAVTVRAAITEAEKKLGPVTALLHGAGTNVPQLISALNETDFRKTVAPKINGVRNVLAAIDPNRLRLLVTFGSIIARTGFRGEADYATANEWLTAFTEQFQTEHPRCRCVALEWSVWSGVGMGERLGRIESLLQQGITPISVEAGTRIFLETLRRPTAPVALVVAGRFGEPPTLKFSEPELPLRRFLERKRIYYPGVELVVDTELSLEADPYLNDHVMQKQRLFPAVLGLEAMAQVAMALAGSTVAPSFENLQLTRPVAVSEKNSTTVRLAALRRGDDLVEVCLRSEETDFQVDHFRAVCRFGLAESGTSRLALSPPGANHVALDPQKDLYGRILFHQGRFCRLRGYRLLKAKECIAEITATNGANWFGPYLPTEFALGDPAGRDAALHAIQACIPHLRILPTGIDSLIIRRNEAGARFVWAKERERNGNDFIYDVEITSAGGEVIERWTGLHLRAVETMTAREPWPDALLATYLERRLEELTGHPSAHVAIRRDEKEKRPARSDTAMLEALGKTKKIWRRPDGKPVLLEDEGVSAAHTQHLTLAVAGGNGVACDMESVKARTDAVWRDLLGDERFTLGERISREQPEELNLAATRLWTAGECMKKVGLTAQSPLVLESATADGWVMLRSGGLAIATWVTAAQGIQNQLGVAVAMQARPPAGQTTAFAKASA